MERGLLGGGGENETDETDGDDDESDNASTSSSGAGGGGQQSPLDPLPSSSQSLFIVIIIITLILITNKKTIDQLHRGPQRQRQGRGHRRAPRQGQHVRRLRPQHAALDHRRRGHHSGQLAW